MYSTKSKIYSLSISIPMSIEFWGLIILGLIITDIYYENKYSKMIYSYKKYYKIVGVIVGGLFIYYILKKQPKENIKNLLASGNNFLKIVPIDKSTSNILSPILDITHNQFSKFSKDAFMNYSSDTPTTTTIQQEQQIINIQKNGGGGIGLQQNIHKRSVSETKKRYVASNQNWKCGECLKSLDHTYEVDHIIALKDGGTNGVNNLKALCPHCHRKKTAKTFL